MLGEYGAAASSAVMQFTGSTVDAFGTRFGAAFFSSNGDALNLMLMALAGLAVLFLVIR
jgi:hypothetical protein